MATQAQIKANRRNAQKSTGPKTAEGKAVVAQNATRHGLFAQQNVINCENRHDFDQFRAELLGGLTPVGRVESMLAERIVSLSWRLRRVERMNSEAIEVMIARAETDYHQKNRREDARRAHDPRAGGLELILGWATVHDFSESRVLERLLGYERRIESSLYKAMAELRKLQHVRESDQANANSAIPSTSLGTGPIPMNDNRDEDATHRRRDVAQAIPGGTREMQGRDAAPAVPRRTLATETASGVADQRDKSEKQSQCAVAQMDVSSFAKEDYGNSSPCALRGNGRRRSQFMPTLNPHVPSEPLLHGETTTPG